MKVKTAIEHLNYTPSALARSFASGKSYTILLMILAESPIITSTWLCELPIIHALMEVLKNSSYSLKFEIASLEDQKGNLTKINDCARSKSADGIILLSPWEPDPKLFHPLEYYGIPYVVIGSDSSGRKTGYINADNQQPIYDLVHLMYEAGGREFALIGGFEMQRDMQFRTKGYLKALYDLELTVDRSRIVYGDFSLKSGYENTLQILTAPNPPDCILCGNDNIAAGAVCAANELNIHIPGQLMISGYDNTVVAEAVSPGITSVSFPSHELGRIAGIELLKKLEDPDYLIPNQLLQCSIFQRKSTARQTSHSEIECIPKVMTTC